MSQKTCSQNSKKSYTSTIIKQNTTRLAEHHNTQQNKINKIDKLNETRQEFEIDTYYRESPLVRSKTTNPFKKPDSLRKLDDKHYE